MDYKSRRNNNKVLKTFKDYLIPLAIVFIILLFTVNNLFFKNDSGKNIEMATPLEVSLDTPDTEGYIIYTGGNKTKLEGKMSMYKTEKLSVAKGSLSIKSKTADLVLNKLGELKYNEDGTYTLYSSDLWVKTNSGINIEMRYAKVSSDGSSVFSLSQNEVASTIYVVSGVVKVQNLAGKEAFLQKGDKLVIMRNNANDDKSDLSLSKEQIDDYIKTDDWFVKNNGNYYLSLSGTNISSSGSLSYSGSTLSGYVLGNDTSGSSYVSFNNIFDEQEVNTNSLDIEGTILSDMVYRIEINGKNAELNNNSKTFSLKGLKLESKTNDLVYKIYDEGNKLITKGVITIYYSSGNSSNNQSLAKVENYPIVSSPLYQILSPKQNPYTTSDDIVRIEGTVPSGIVEKIVINDFELRKFPKYGSYWSYFANSQFGNLKDGVNIYKIQYFGAGGKILYENNFTIIKEPKKLETPTGTLENTSSGVSQEISSGVTQ